VSVPRRVWLDALVAALDPARDLLVAGLGANARYLPHLSVPVPHVALCDAMGAAIPLALGMALARPDRRVIALEGDGSLLMNLGTLATVAAAQASNLTALVFVNHHYESSGGQRLPAVEADFAAVARAAGLATAEHVAAAGDLAAALARGAAAGPALLVLPTVYDAAEAIPPYSERPEAIRLSFRRALQARAKVEPS
jgi:thiamine pyrophosphate-dependent acetolactate synthase large subunit-like protein